MPRPPKSLNSFPAICATIWEAVIHKRIRSSSDVDPADYPFTQYLEFPDRRSCAAIRHPLIQYRSTFGDIAYSFPLSGKPGSTERQASEDTKRQNILQYHSMNNFSVSMRNMRSPLIRKITTIHSLPDGPHRLYFINRNVDLDDSIRSQITSPPPSQPETNASRLVGTGSSPAQRALEDLGYSPATRGKHETIPLSDDELFEEDPSDA